MDIISPLMDRNPQLALAYDWWETANHINEAMDFPQIGLVSKKEYDERVAADNEAKAKQQAQLMAIEMAKASKSVSGPVDQSSVLAGATA